MTGYRTIQEVLRTHAPDRRDGPARVRGHRPGGPRPGRAGRVIPVVPTSHGPPAAVAGRGPGPGHQDRRAHPGRGPAGGHPLRRRPPQQQRRLRRPVQAARLQGREDQRQGRRDDDDLPRRRPGGDQRRRRLREAGHRDPGLRGGLPQGLRAGRDLGRPGLRRRRLVHLRLHAALRLRPQDPRHALRRRPEEASSTSSSGTRPSPTSWSSCSRPVLALILSGYLINLYTKPVKRIIDASTEMALGFYHRIEVDPHDDADARALAQAFNGMVDAIEERDRPAHGPGRADHPQVGEAGLDRAHGLGHRPRDQQPADGRPDLQQPPARGHEGDAVRGGPQGHPGRDPALPGHRPGHPRLRPRHQGRTGAGRPQRDHRGRPAHPGEARHFPGRRRSSRSSTRTLPRGQRRRRRDPVRSSTTWPSTRPTPCRKAAG
ncbi:MAG: hypothetical protein M0C28_12775 [Candidatus Moduliflexus flocculans]|nr:hypothetical protein [Candidatus Moduliflexus flocculans]